ncbi:AraC-like DNA-binding protein [Crossiella equi]|uniref:AraC-like DNA-binding protein n=1 Tax=Crossiella equi TaxID=130796 RepID=A0ABS5AQT0_9PSEU|nr:helix-turn-helix transcriptional regulator [Crossiella equi]MBP2478910.1 AraC-like DNA-binding protein [Crossiella equi]
MVETGHTFAPAQVAHFGFQNPDRPDLGVEVLRLSQLLTRLRERTIATVHRTDFHQLFLITEGTGAAMVDFDDHACAPGTLLNVAPSRVLRLPQPLAGQELEAFVVLFTPDFPPRLDHARALLGPFGPAERNVPLTEWPGLTAAMHELHTEYRRAVREDPEPASEELLRHLLGALLLRLARLPGLPPEPGDGAYQRFQEELERSFASTRNASDYATRIGYSLRSLNRACLAATGQTAKALIDGRVALEAKRLLAHSDLPVAAVSRRLGFSEPTNFGKFFARETGVSPGAFRDREHRDQHLA